MCAMTSVYLHFIRTELDKWHQSGDTREKKVNRGNTLPEIFKPA